MENIQVIALDGVAFKVGEKLENLNCIVTSIFSNDGAITIDFEHVFASCDNTEKYFSLYVENEFMCLSDEFGNGYNYRDKEDYSLLEYIENYFVNYECFIGETSNIEYLYYNDEELIIDEDFLLE